MNYPFKSYERVCFCLKSYELVSGGDLFAKYFLKKLFWHTWHCHHGKNGTYDRELFCLNTCNADVNKYINVTATFRVHININVLDCIHSDCWKLVVNSCWSIPSYLMATPVLVPKPSVVNSTKRCLVELTIPSLGRYSTSYESYKIGESMWLPFLIRNLQT